MLRHTYVLWLMSLEMIHKSTTYKCLVRTLFLWFHLLFEGIHSICKLNSNNEVTIISIGNIYVSA